MEGQQRQCVFGAAWDDAGTRLAASDAHGRICVWDDPFSAAAAAEEEKKKARVWKQRQRQQRQRGVLRSDEESSPVYALAALSAAETCGGDGCSQRLLSGGVGGVALWKWRSSSDDAAAAAAASAKEEEPIATIESDCNGGETNGIAVAAAAGRFVRAVGTFGVRSRDGCVAVHNAATLQQTSVAMGSAGCGAFLCVASLSSSSDFGGNGSGVRFAAGSEDGCVRIFDDRCSSAATLCCCLQRCECGGSATKATVLSVAADGPWIASGDAAGCVALWHIAAPARPLAVAAAGSAVTALCFAGDSSSSSSATKTRHLLCGTAAGRVMRMSVSGRVESERSAPCGAVFAIAERPTASVAGNAALQQPSERLAMSASVLHSEPTVVVAGLSETVCVLRGSVCAAELAFPSPA